MIVRVMPYLVAACGLSDIGLVRQNNEDVWDNVPEIGFYVLADGMGGHRAGEIASHEAVDFLCLFLKESIKKKLSTNETIDLLYNAIQKTNKEIYNLSHSHDELKGMGTTLCCLLFQEKVVIYANVGDSRIYRLRDGKLIQMTKDHSLLRELIDNGEVNENQITSFLYKGIITRAIGTEEEVEPFVDSDEVHKNDIYFMCTDGLSDMLSHQDIEEILNQPVDLQAKAAALVEKAKEKGGYDNITLVITQVKEANAAVTKDLSR